MEVGILLILFLSFINLLLLGTVLALLSKVSDIMVKLVKYKTDEDDRENWWKGDIP